MKQKLILFQPKQYNELFSTYHNSKKYIEPNLKINLPKISTNLPKEWESAASTSRTNISTSNNIFHNKNNSSYKKTSYIFNRNKELHYPIETKYKGSETTRIPDFLPYPSITQHFKKIVDSKSKEKKKIERNNTELKMVYLDLVSGENNKNEYKIESYLTENFEKDKNKQNIINSKNNEINNKNKTDSIFVQTEDSKFKNEISSIDNIPIILINLFAEEIYKNYYNKEYSNRSRKNIISENVKQSYNNNINRNLYINNKFFKYVLDNVKHKIEVINQSNKQISVLYVKNLINSELKYLQKQLSNYKKQYYTENTSNNISKISNYEIASGSSFKFKTNNNSSIKDNDASTNNNSSQLGSLILKNIYAKKNEGTKKRKFDMTNIFYKVSPNQFFQNKEIISSINKKDEERNSKKIKIFINSYNSRKTNSDDEINNTTTNHNLTSNSVDLENKRLKSKIFNKNINKKIPRTFSQVFLKTDYKKESDIIKEISNKIEKKFLFKKNKRKINKSKENIEYNKNGKEKYNYIIRDKQEEVSDYIITPKRSKKNMGTNTDFREGKIKIKNEKMKNNYEKIITQIQSIKNIKGNVTSENYYTPSKTIIENNKELNHNKKGKQKKIHLNKKKLMQKYNDNILNKKIDNEIINNIIDKKYFIENYIDNNNNSNNNHSIKKTKKLKEKYSPKNTIDSIKRKNNKDLNSIKTSKPSNKKSKENNKDTIYSNSINSNKKINNKKNINNKNSNILNNNKKNNNINVYNPNEIINKLSIKVDDSEEENYSIDEESEDEEDEYEEEEEDEDEEEEDEEDDNLNEEEKKMKKFLKKIKKEKKNIAKKKKKKKKESNQNLINKLKNEFEIMNENNNKKTTNNQINQNYEKIMDSKNQEQAKNKRFNKRISVFIPTPKNIIAMKPQETTPKKNKKERPNSIKNKTEKTKKKTSTINVENYSHNKNKKKTDIRKKLFSEKENKEEELEEEKLDYLRNNNLDEYYKNNLIKNKKTKKYGGKGKANEKFIKGKNDDAVILLEENVDDLIERENNKLKKKNSFLFDKEEEIKILKELDEMDEGLTIDEKKYIISEMLDLRKLLINSDKEDKDIKRKINLKRISIYKMVNKYFINWILKDLSMKIIAPQKYKKKLDKLVKIRSLRIYSEINLKKLEINYIIPFIKQEEKRKKDEEERKAKLARRKLALEEFERYKRLIEEKKKKELIYDNSYLFKKEKNKQFKLRKEVEEILNTDYGNYYNYKKKNIKSEGKKRKIIKKKKGKQNVKKNSIFTKEELTQEEKDDEEKRLRLLKEIEEKERMEEIRDKKLKDFFERIQRLKKGYSKNFDEELNFLIDEQIDQTKKIQKDKEDRMNSFMKDLNFTRVKAKYNIDFKSKQICFISPIIFSYKNKNKSNI